MAEVDVRARRYYFSTRDLLIMAVLAGLGGVTSTAVNALGDVVQAALGFAGTTQWAAGLHVTFLILVVGLTNKGGAATIAGLLKGGVELLSGNTHGVIVLVVDFVAGLFIDLALVPFRQKDSRWAYVVAGALASASNVFIFQLLASAPEDVLAFVWGIAGLAALSGAGFGGLLAHSLLTLLRRGGLARPQPLNVMRRWHYAAFLVGCGALALGSGLYLARTLAGPPKVVVVGDCAGPFEYYAAGSSLPTVSRDLVIHGMKRRVSGTLLREILAEAKPNASANAVLVTASDGYSFFITLREIEGNPDLVLAHRGENRDITYEIAGAVNPKAWVRNVSELRLVPQALIGVSGSLDRPFPYNPDDWQLVMDSGELDLGDGVKKYQGTSLKDVVEKWEPASTATLVRLVQRGGGSVELPLETVMREPSIRIWNVNTAEGIRFAITKTDGDVYARDVVAIAVE